MKSFGFAMAALPLVGLWWVTAGEFDLHERMNFGEVYEALAQSWLDGRADISCDVASGEAFVRDKKCYVYFGAAPALLRIPFLPAQPAEYGRLGRRMVWIAQLLMLAVVGLILVEAGHRPGSLPFAGYLLLVGFGSTVPYMWGWPSTYTEAIVWAVTFAMGSLYCLVRWANDKRDGWLIAGCLLAMLAFFTRVNTGAGLMLAVGLTSMYALVRGHSRRGAALALVLLSLSAYGYVANNHRRFGTYFNSVPIQLHVQYDAARLQRIGGTLFHPEKAPAILLDYLFQVPRFRASYPWLEFRSGSLTGLGAMDLLEPHAGIAAISPALAWLAWAGWRTSRKRAIRWFLLSPLLGLVLLASVAAINHRYVHEFLLLLVPAGAYGLRWAAATRARRVVTLALSAWSVYACSALALVGQREVMPWVNDDAVDRHRGTRFLVDRWLGLKPAYPAVFDYVKDPHPPPPVTGARVRILPSGSEYRYDGRQWQRQSGLPVHRFPVKVRFQSLPAGSIQLLVAGQPPEADLVSLDQTGQGRYRVRLDHWSAYPESGTEFTLEAGRDYLFDCEMDRLNRRVRVSLDGTVVAARKAALWRWLESEVAIRP